MKICLLCALIFLAINAGFGQAELVKDINTAPASTANGQFINFKGSMYFVANNRLWRSDGTTIGTYEVEYLKDIWISPFQSVSLQGAADFMLFPGSDPMHGLELWKTDGTPDGTEMVMDITPGIASSGLGYFIYCGNKVYFSNYNYESGWELWISDGTAEGTFLIKLFQGSLDLRTSFYTGTELVFFANDGVGKAWKTNGTTEGTTSIFNSSGTGFTLFNGKIYFSGNSQLWRMDPVALIPEQVSTAGANGFKLESNPELTVFMDELYFVAEDNNVGTELWSFDAIGNLGLVDDIAAGNISSSPHFLTVAGSNLYFVSDDNLSGNELWKTDGVSTIQVKDINPGSEGSPYVYDEFGNSYSQLVGYGDKVLYLGTDGVNGAEWWTSDGTESGTLLIADFNSGPASLNSSRPFNFDNLLYFFADNGVIGNELYKTNGEVESIELVKEVSPGTATSNILRIFKSQNEIIFFADEGDKRNLWITNGSQTNRVKEYNDNSDRNTRIYSFGSKSIFSLSLKSSGREAWISDGTSEGTSEIIDLNPGTPSGAINLYATNSNLFFFSGNDGIHGSELWKSDGTSEGTELIADINAGTASSNPSWFFSLGANYYFIASDGAEYGLWKTNGEASGTSKVKGLGTPFNLLIGGNSSKKAYFFNIKNDHSYDLWTTDGTSGGTTFVKNLSGNRSPYDSAMLENKFYFFFDDGIHGNEPWVTDGTSNGTKMIKDIFPGSNNASYTGITMIVCNDKIYFSADDGEHGYELWESDGTESGTKLFADLVPGPSDSNPGFLRSYNNNLFFGALSDGVAEAWYWNSAMEMPKVLGGLNPSNYELINNTLFFLADDPQYGRELWKYEFKEGELAEPGPEPEPEPITAVENGANSIKIFPIPTSGLLTLEGNVTSNEVRVRDMMGRVVKVDVSDNVPLSIDLSYMPAGMYLIEISGKHAAKSVIKVMKQ